MLISDSATICRGHHFVRHAHTPCIITPHCRPGEIASANQQRGPAPVCDLHVFVQCRPSVVCQFFVCSGEPSTNQFNLSMFASYHGARARTVDVALHWHGSALSVQAVVLQSATVVDASSTAGGAAASAASAKMSCFMMDLKWQFLPSGDLVWSGMLRSVPVGSTIGIAWLVESNWRPDCRAPQTPPLHVSQVHASVAPSCLRVVQTSCSDIVHAYISLVRVAFCFLSFLSFSHSLLLLYALRGHNSFNQFIHYQPVAAPCPI